MGETVRNTLALFSQYKQRIHETFNSAIRRKKALERFRAEVMHLTETALHAFKFVACMPTSCLQLSWLIIILLFSS